MLQTIEPIPYVVTTMLGQKAVVLAISPEKAAAAMTALKGIGVRDIYRVLPFDHRIEMKARKAEGRQ